MMLLNLPEKDQVAEKIIKGLPKDNDKYYIEHTKNSNTSTIKQQKATRKRWPLQNNFKHWIKKLQALEEIS